MLIPITNIHKDTLDIHRSKKIKQNTKLQIIS